MSNDNKTLADVQPGGRVRLGNQALSTSEGARRHVADFFATQLRRHDFGDYILTELAGDFACALAQHLSAQPSPGGQHGVWMLPDDARIVGVIADSIERGKLDHPGFYRNTQLGEVLRRVLSAVLAARQPVDENYEVWAQNAENVAAELTDERAIKALRFAARGIRSAARHQVRIYGCCAQPEGEMHTAECPNMRHLAARLPVGEPVAWYYGFSDTGEAGPVTFGGNPGAEAIAWAERHGHTLHYLYAAPPAQALDLERFRGTVKSQYSMTEWMHRCGFVSAEKLEESKKNHDHLMALIDSQAVGNG